jgi:hypothetical protein
MAAARPRRFSNSSALKEFAHSRLRKFTARFADFLRGRDVPELPENDDDEYDYTALGNALMNPEEDTPKDLIDALFLINAMADKEGRDAILEYAAEKNLDLELPENPTAAETALAMWLHDAKVLEGLHTEHFATRDRNFIFFRARPGRIPAFKVPTAAEKRELCKYLDEWFVKKKRGEGCRVHFFDAPDHEIVWILVQHGDVFQREGAYEDGEPSSVFFRPEKYDVLIYNKTTGELGVFAGTRGEEKQYCARFGEHLFGESDFFRKAPKYTLEPLQTVGEASLACADVDHGQIEKITLREVKIAWNPKRKDSEVLKSLDLFESLRVRGRTILPLGNAVGRIVRARFDVKFTDAEKPRQVTITVPNGGKYERDEDGELIDAWLRLRGFILPTEEEAEAEANEVVAAN